MPQYFFNGNPCNGCFILEGKEAHHASKVKRAKEGDELFLFDAQENRYKGIVKKISRSAVEGQLVFTFPKENKPLKKFLCFAPVDRAQTELVLDQCTQLGADTFQFIITERTQDNLSAKWHLKIERFNEIVLSAVKQCMRASIPKINAPVTFDQAVLCFPNIIMANEKGGQSFAQIKEGLKEAEQVSLFVGPQGGFTEREFNFAQSHNVSFASLGSNILKTETACAAVCSLML